MTRKLLALLFLTVPVFAQSHQATRPPKPQTPDFSRAAPVPVQNGVFINGKELYKYLLLANLPRKNDDDTSSFDMAVGYLMGVADADEKVCMPTSFKASELVLEMRMFLEKALQNTEQPIEKVSGGAVIRYALEHKYACPATPSETGRY